MRKQTDVVPPRGVPGSQVVCREETASSAATARGLRTSTSSEYEFDLYSCLHQTTRGASHGSKEADHAYDTGEDLVGTSSEPSSEYMSYEAAASMFASDPTPRGGGGGPAPGCSSVGAIVDSDATGTHGPEAGAGAGVGAAAAAGDSADTCAGGGPKLSTPTATTTVPSQVVAQESKSGAGGDDSSEGAAARRRVVRRQAERGKRCGFTYEPELYETTAAFSATAPVLDLPPKLASVVMPCLAWDPDGRPTADDVATALAALAPADAY